MDDRERLLATLAALRDVYRGKEALFRPSSISRVIGCAGSVALCAAARAAGHVRLSSAYAREGQAAHVVAQQALSLIRQPDEWTDRMVQLDDGGMHGEFVGEEMVEAVSAYVEDVRSAMEPGDALLVEHYMTLAALDPDDPVMAENRGTGDAVILKRAKRRVVIEDLKYGKGVMVAGDSPQLLNYATLAVVSFPDDRWDEVEVVVSQPRAARESERRKAFTFAVVDLMTGFMGTLMESMHAALAPDPPLKTGDWCRWCDARAAGICPAIEAEGWQVGRFGGATAQRLTAASGMGPIPPMVYVATADSPAPPPDAPAGTVVLPSAVLATPEEIATVLGRRHLYDVWIQSYEQRAAALLEAGVRVPGWMLSARRGNRRWKGDEAETQRALMEMGLKVVEIYPPPRLLSPAQVEKRMKAETRGLLEPLVERPEGKPTLMRETDGRTAVGSGMGPIAEISTE